MTSGVIFDIQRFSTHDGPGIRTVVFLKGCPLRCYWCQNPESQRMEPILLQRQEACIGCGRCVSACPQGAASLRTGASVIDRALCIGCGACAGVCPAEALTISGYTVTVEDVLAEVLKDRAYYQNSGGGVTLSGGEAAMQPAFSATLLKACKRNFLHTAVETCGFASEEAVRGLIPFTDLFLYDIKAVDSSRHRAGTGQGNEQIKHNAKLLAEAGCGMRIRMPLIPGYNDSREDVLALRCFVEEELSLDAGVIELLKYNALGEVKFRRLGRTDAPSLRTQSDEYLEELKNLLR